jgi:plastocyanin domain-containing protein
MKVFLGSRWCSSLVWFFLLQRSRSFGATEMSGGHQEAMIVVKGRYTPDTIIVHHG